MENRRESEMSRQAIIEYVLWFLQLVDMMGFSFFIFSDNNGNVNWILDE